MSRTRVALEANGFTTFVVGAMFGALFSRHRNLHHYHHQEDESEYYYPYRPHQARNKTISTSSPGVKNPATAIAPNMEAKTSS
ncbi:hypothetical protein M0R45_034775 [Rubus argutus]|uniref:Uncharacterized protein n=1 Tax=Rubus argutus TaxID=59490 RepID=A0AAW1VSV1_RUBAR